MKENKLKFKQFLEAEKNIQEKGYAIVGNTVLISKDLWDRSQNMVEQYRLLAKQVGRAN